MFVADTQRDRYGDDPAEHGRPESVDELFVVTQEQDQLVAAAGADALQVMQDPERALVELREGDAARVVLSFEIGDAAGEIAVAFEQLGQRRGVQHQRRSNLMCRG